MDLFGHNGAEFSGDRRHRYALWRIWDKEKPLIMFIGLNPSKANEIDSDNTVTRVRGFANKWGYGGFFMMNLFSLVSTDPDRLVQWEITEQEDYLESIRLNDSWLNNIRKSCKDVVFAWGSFKQAKKRAKEVIRYFPDAMALQINKDGSPKHPLYVSSSVKPIKFLYHDINRK